MRYIEFSSKSLKMLPAKFTARMRVVEEEMKQERIKALSKGHPSLKILSTTVKTIAGEYKKTLRGHKRSPSPSNPNNSRRPSLEIKRVIANEDKAFMMKRPIFQNIRPEGRLDHKMASFDKSLRSGTRDTHLR